MISGEKEFGAYKLLKCHYYDDEEDEEEAPLEHVSTCYFGSKWVSCVLDSVDKYNSDTSIFRFRLPDPSARLNLPIGGVLLARAIGRDHDGTDAIRPYASITDDITVGYFEVLCKRYDEWGQKETPTSLFFGATNHAYKPPGAMSEYIHSLVPGQALEFKHNRKCLPRFQWPLPEVTTITVIAVGAGLAPIIQLMRAVFEHNRTAAEAEAAGEDAMARPRIRITLLYGVRVCEDILCKEQLELWRNEHEFNVVGDEEPEMKVIYCVGSRWGNVNFGSLTTESYLPPNTPSEFDTLRNAETGWVNEDKVRRHAFPPSPTTRVFVCGLPGVYDKLCGPRTKSAIPMHSILGRLNYTEEMVIKY